MARLRWLWGAYWQKCLLFIAACAGILSLLLYKLGSLTAGLAANEQAISPTRPALHQLLQNPLYLPLKVLRIIVSFTPYHGYTASRLPNVALALLTLGLFVYLVRVWSGPRTAWYGTIVLSCAPWFLHVARSATIDILYPLALLALLIYTVKVQLPHRRWFFLVTPLLFSMILYIPGMVWLVVLCCSWYREDFKAMWGSASGKLRAQWILLWPVCLSLLGHAFWLSPKLAIDWAGLPHRPPHPMGFLHNFGAVWAHIFVRGPQLPTIGLGYLPLLNGFMIAMFIIGAYFYVSHWRALRSRLLASLLVLSTALVALGGGVSISVLLPLIYALSTGGLGYLGHEWFKTFPHNPLARALGYTLVFLILMFSTMYNIRQYFIAWPRAQVTKAAFVRGI